MADNVNPQAIRFVNEKIRPASDRIMQTYNYMKALQAEYTAQGASAYYPAGDPTGRVMDGAHADGRPTLTNVDVINIITALGAFLTHIEASSNQNRDRYLKAAVNTDR